MLTTLQKPQSNRSTTTATSTITWLVIIMSTITILYPDIVLADASLEQQLDKIGAVANGKFKTIGLTAATIAGAIWSVIQGNVKLTGIIIAIGICLSLYLEWIAGGMVLTA